MTHDHLPDRALSIRQPWVWAFLNAGKDIENRPRRFHYRGPICIHASLYEPKKDDFDAVWHAVVAANSDAMTYENVMRTRHRFGGIVGTAEIIDCVDESDSPWFFGPFGLKLANVQPVKFIPVKGALGLFKWKNNIKGDQL